jgi:hypothetical protein
MAKQWPAYTQWQYANGGVQKLKDLIGDRKVKAFKPDSTVSENHEDYQGNFFKPKNQEQVSYASEFMSRNNRMTVRDASLFPILKEYIIEPDFYSSLADVSAIELTQGKYFVEDAHYSVDDRFVCLVEGTIHLRLVPHINWNSMYTGKEERLRYSRVNLFNGDVKQFPKIKYIEKMYKEVLNSGDCIFIPAYYFAQMAGEANVQELKSEMKPTAIVLSLMYKSNNALLGAYFDAIESGQLQ